MLRARSFPRILIMLAISSGLILIRTDEFRMLICTRISKAMALNFSDRGIGGEAVASPSKQPEKPRNGSPVMALDCDSIMLGINSRGEIVSRLTRDQVKGIVLARGCRTDRYMIDGAIPFPEVGIALSLLESLRRYPFIAHKTKAIDLSDSRNPRIELEDSVVVDMGLDDYDSKLRRLGQIVAYSEILSLDIHRVDLRFGNQVIVEAEELQSQKSESGAEAKRNQMVGG